GGDTAQGRARARPDHGPLHPLPQPRVHTEQRAGHESCGVAEEHSEDEGALRRADHGRGGEADSRLPGRQLLRQVVARSRAAGVVECPILRLPSPASITSCCGCVPCRAPWFSTATCSAVVWNASSPSWASRSCAQGAASLTW